MPLAFMFGMRTALDQADAAMKPNGVFHMFRGPILPGNTLRSSSKSVSSPEMHSGRRSSEKTNTERKTPDIGDMRADFAALLESCINSAGICPLTSGSLPRS